MNKSGLLAGSLPLSLFCLSTLFLATGAGNDDDAKGKELELEEARIFFEYNATDNDLGVHVFLDGEDWKKIKISTPNGKKIFEVQGKGPYAELGMTELFFEGAEPSLDDVPLQELLSSFPEGEYEFEGRTVDGQDIEGESELSHAVPNAPPAMAVLGANNSLVISWTAPTGTPPGFPDRRIEIVGYEVIVDDEFEVTVPASVTSLTVSPEFVATLGSGEHEFEVLAMDKSGNKSITEDEFVK